MLAYAAPRPGREAARPRTLMLIIAGHVLVIGAAMLARDKIQKHSEPPIIVVNVPPVSDPPPNPQPHPRSDPRPSHPTTVVPQVPIPTLPDQGFVAPPIPPGPFEGIGVSTLPPPQPQPHEILRHGPQIATAEGRLRPPYPETKRMQEEEATLTLRLSIDATGRVTAVEPIGTADRAFLDSARKHLLSVWRFTPATEDGQPVPSTKVITLHFELGEA